MGILIADTNLLFSDPVDYQSKWALRTERTWEIANELATLYGPDELAVEGLRGLDVVERKNLDPFYQAEGNTILTVLMKEPKYTELGIHPKSQEHEISSHNNFFGEVDKGALELILCGVAEKVCEEWHCNYDMSGQDDKELVFEMYWDAIPGEDFERMIARLELQESDGEDGKEYSILAVGLPLKQYLNEVMAEDQIHFLMPETKRHSKDKPDYHNHVLTQTGVQAAYESRGCSPNCGPETHIPRPRPHRG